MKGIGC